MLWSKKIKTYIKEKPIETSWLVVLLAVTILIFAYFGFFSPSLQNVSQTIADSHLQTARETKDKVDKFLDDNVRALKNLAEVVSLTDSKQQAEEEIEKFIKERGWFSEITVVSNQGQELLKVSQFSAISSEDLKNVSYQKSFQEANYREVYFGEVNSSEKGIPYVTVGLPLGQPFDKIYGVLLVKLSFQEIWSIISEVKVGENGNAYLVDYDGYIIAHPDTSLVLKKENVLERPIVSQVLKEKIEVSCFDHAGEYYLGNSGKIMMAVGLPLEKIGGGIFVEEPENEAMSAYNRIRNAAITLYFVALALITILIVNTRALARAFEELKKRGGLLKLESEERKQELEELDKATKLLIRRDMDLQTANNELDQKIGELEKSKKSLLQALVDIEKARKKSEEEKNKTLSIISNFTDPIIVLGKSDTITLFNPAAQEKLGLILSDIGTVINSKNNYSLKAFSSVIRKNFILKKLFSQDPSIVLLEEIEIKNEKNDSLTYKVITSSILGRGKEYLGTMKLFYDLTREKMMDKMKSEFISVAAHQLRTPLSAIKWTMRMILDGDAGDLNEEQRDLLQKGYISNERIISLVNDLLNISRIEEGRFGYKFEKCNFENALHIAVENCEKLIAKNHINLSVNKPALLPDVYIDKEKIVMVLQNLLENSVKYTPEFGRINISLKPEENFLRISMKDNGVGIPKSDMEKVFSKFFRASNVIRLDTEGTGLGLFIVKNIIEKHGGSIMISSEEGIGTKINFTLPYSKR